jgi:ParB family chromosome partitioning protein
MSNAEQTEFEQGTLEHLDPNVLETDGNVRDDPALTKQFIASIKENGVLVPITAVRAQDGTVRVRTGQRRTLAAREAGLETIPVYVIGAGWEDVTQRTIEQLVENDHRTTLTQVQRVRGIQQLLDVGLSATKVAKKLSVSRERVQASQAVAGSQTALDALAAGQLSLTEAAAITEFEDDERAVARLLESAGRPQFFEHTLSQLREQREDAQRLAAGEQEWRDKGYTVLDRAPAPYDPDFVEWGFLLKDGQELPDDYVITDPKHWAVVLWEETVLTNTETGEEVDEADVDWETQDDPDATPEEGKLHADKVVETEAIVPEFYYCIDLAGAGLTVNERFARYSGQSAQLDAEGGNSDSGNQVDRVDEIGPVLVDEKAEAEKRERRKVLALNKLGDSALGVRRQFVRNLLARKTPPKGAAIFVARMLSGDPHLLSDYKADEVTAELLGAEHVDGSGYQYSMGKTVRGVAKLVAALPDNGDGRAAVITLGLVLGALESRTPKDGWREDKWSRERSIIPYLEFLAANGYEPADIELVMTGKKKADKVYDAYLAAQ